MNVYRVFVRENIVFMVLVVLMTVSAGNAQKMLEKGWYTYEPDKELFSMNVPGIPSLAQGHIFDPEDEAIAYKFFDNGLKSRVFNFEIVKGKSRKFLVSILYVQTKKSTSLGALTVKEADIIDMTIGDEVIRSTIVSLSTKNEMTSKWTYGRKDGDRGRVLVKRSSRSLVVVVVDCDFASTHDPEIDIMLDSFSVKRK